MSNQDKVSEYLFKQVPELKAAVGRDGDSITVRADFRHLILVEAKEYESPDLLRLMFLKEIHKQIGLLADISQKLKKPIDD